MDRIFRINKACQRGDRGQRNTLKLGFGVLQKWAYVLSLQSVFGIKGRFQPGTSLPSTWY